MDVEKPQVSIIIVTHNSQSVLPLCLEAIDRQSVSPRQIIIVDSGSDDSVYLAGISERNDITLTTLSNIGFAAANNRGLEQVDSESAYVLFINPDTFPAPSAIEKSILIMETRPDVAILTGLLEGYDPGRLRTTGKVDSAGIFRAWYGRWFDRGHGEDIGSGYQRSGYVPAICGAFMFCRFSALKSELPVLFDESFFMYKEDIELCLRLSGKGWKMFYTPEIRAYHCRGWNLDRRLVPRNVRIMSARNEIRLYQKHPSAYMVWAWLKYVLVRYFDA